MDWGISDAYKPRPDRPPPKQPRVAFQLPGSVDAPSSVRSSRKVTFAFPKTAAAADGAAAEGEAAAEAAAEAAVETGVSCGLGASAASEAEAAGVAAAAASHMCAAGPSGVVLGAEEDRHALMHTRCPGSGRAAAAWVRVADLR